MSRTDLTQSGSRRLHIFLVLLAFATTVQLFRIGYVSSSTGETPFLSANDRSRWCTILALTTHGSYVIDDVLAIRDPHTKRRTWYSIDIVQHRGPDGKQHFYSSKPPLLSTLYAGVYWVVRGVTGATLTGQPFVVARWMLFLVNLLPLMGLWWLMSRWANRTEFNLGQVIYLWIFAMFGTFLSTFVITLNNHLPSALAVAVSMLCVHRILIGNDHHPGWFLLCGLATSFAVATELPALSWLAMVGMLLLRANWRWALAGYAPSLLPIMLAFVGTNYLAHGTIRPAYSMRDLGPFIVEVQTRPTDFNEADLEIVRQALSAKGFELSPQTIVRKARRPDVWELWDEATQWKFALKWNSSNQRLGVYHWGDWYDYPNSYWKDDRKQGVDRGEPSIARYALHCLIGHHGVFSLTPFWILSVVGLVALAHRASRGGWWSNAELQMGVAIGLTSLVVMVFYLTRPLEDRNYGGVTSGLRWTFWLIPLWYWLAVRGMGLVRHGWQFWTVSILLAVSIFSATFPWSNPWTTPWLTRWIPL